MKKQRGDRTVTEIYDRTQKIPRSEIEGSNCKGEIGDMAGNDVKKEKASPTRKRKISNSESGVCNVCCAPCSSCFHRMKAETEISSFCEHENCSETSSRASYCEHENGETKSKLKNPNCKHVESKNPKNEEGFKVRSGSEIKQEGQGENSSCVTKDKLNNEKCDVVSSKDKTEMETRVFEKSLKMCDKLGVKIDDANCSQEDKMNSEIRVSEKVAGKVNDAIISTLEKSEDKIRVSDKNPKVDEKQLEIGCSGNANEIFEETEKDEKPIVPAKLIDSDGLIDVNVCDICGDSGREELLATCTKCIDGAEHTYCMRVKMDSLPKGDWLCEECQLKNYKEQQNKNKTRIITPRSTRSEKENHKTNNLNSKNPFKRLRVSTDSSDLAVIASPKNVFKEPVSSPRKNTGNNSRDNLVKNIEKMKMEKISPKDSQIVKGNNMNVSTSINTNINSKNMSRSYSLSSIASPKGIEKAKQEILSPKVNLTKHLSFKTQNPKTKIKSLTENLAQKQKSVSISKPIPQEESRFKKPVKTNSFKEGSFEAMKQQFKLREEERREKEREKEEREREKEKKVGENKDLVFKGEKSRSGNLVPKTGTVIKKSEAKCDGVGNKKAEFGSGSNVNKEQALLDKKRDLPIVEKKKLFSQPKEIRSPRSIQILNENPKKPSKWKPAIKTVISKGNKSEGKTVIIDKSEDQVSKSRVSDTLTPKSRVSDSLTPKSKVLETSGVHKAKKAPLLRDQNANSNNLEGPSKTRVSELSRASSFDLVPNSGVLPKDMLSRSSSLEIPANLNVNNTNLKDLDVKLPSHVLPEHNFVWQGNFEIFRNGNPKTETYEGIQAHFSTLVSPKVVEIAGKFENNLKLEVVNCATIWPAQFKDGRVNEEHIALFFFAKDIQSYDNSYRRLLQNILGDDLALKGNIHGAELLIFPSNKLPEPSQKWNSLVFLWGVFRAKKQDSLIKTSLNSSKLISGSEPSSSKIIPMKMNKNDQLLPVENNPPKLKMEELTFVGQISNNTGQNNLNKDILHGPSLIGNNSSISVPISKQDENAKLGTKKRAHPSSSSSSEEESNKRKCGNTDGHVEFRHTGSDNFLNKLTSPKTNRLTIDLEKPAEIGNEEGLSMLDINKVPNMNLGFEDGIGNPSFMPVPLPLFPPARVKEEEKDESLALSLSLTVGPSGSQIERENDVNENKSVVKVQQFLPEKPDVKKGKIRLFGGYIDP